MAVSAGVEPISQFEQWYTSYDVSPRDGCLEFKDVAACAGHYYNLYMSAKREMDLRVANYEVLEKLADGEVISEKPDLPNISSGETAGLVRRIARNLVQNTPNVEVISKFDDDDMQGHLGPAHPDDEDHRLGPVLQRHAAEPVRVAPRRR